MSPLALLLWSAALPGCECEPDRPYVPFEVQAQASSSARVAPSASAAADATPAAFERAKAVLAPRDATEWTLEGVKLKAPARYRFERGLAADFDGDERLDAVAWVVPADESDATLTPGELYFYSGDTARRVTGTPPYVPTGPGCTLAAELERTGPKTVTLDVSARCDRPLVPRSPVRGIVVLAPAAPRPEVLALRLAEPAPGETMAFSVDSADRDGDERDDVRVEATLLAEGTSREATAQFVWLDRATGPARTPTEPTRSLTDLGSVEVVRAGGKNTATQVHERVDNARRLYAALCAESGTSRVFDGEGAPLPCTGLEKAFEWFVTADVKSALTRGDFVAAFGALERANWYGPVDKKAVEKLEAELRSKVVVRKAGVKPVGPVPRLRAGIPRWSPLWFEPDGALLVQTVAGIERVAPDGASAGSADEEVDAWPSIVADEQGNRLWGVGLPCDRSEVTLLQTAANGAALPPIPTGILAPRPGACARGAGPAVDLPAVVEWSDQRRLVVVAATATGDLAAASRIPSPGSARSPDGKRLIVVTSRGLLVTGGDRPELWQPEGGTAGYADCVVANGGKAAACIKDARARLLAPQ